MIKQADECDIPIIEDILLDTVNWMSISGLQNRWDESNVKWSSLSKSYEINNFYIAYQNGLPAACMAITNYDPTYWPNIPKGESLYLHKVAVKRAFAGKGFSKKLIGFAKDLARSYNINAIRLNCNKHRYKLRALYENEGFICVEEKTFFDRYDTALYVCNVKELRDCMNIKEKIAKLLAEISSINEIKAIGQTGDISAVPKAGESDIDIFILGDKVPSYEDRKAIYDKNNSLFEQCVMNVCEGGEWGTGDIFSIDCVETMLMYFNTDDTLNYLNEILEGKHLDSIKGFYPVGRCATLKTINIIYDELGILRSIKEKLLVYPDELRNKMINFHFSKTLDDESFGRAILRMDVLFYHRVIEHSIDHYLQALYAVNKTYFPSRKRTKQYIDSFEIKPQNCYDRLLDVIKLGSSPDSIEKSYGVWRELVNDLKCICNL